MDHIVSVQTSYQTISGTRKEKKKQGKDELDRLRQAEKKKRRLEKALATSAAIRSELEKKKQKKKEEQQRLDEEGAAIAEAVALHVLVDEDSDEAAEVVSNKDREIGLRQSAQLGFVPWNSVAGVGNIGLYFGGRRKDTLCQNGAKGWGSIKYSLGSDSRERILDSREAEWQQNEWDPLHRRSSSRANRDNLEINGRLLGFGGGCSQWENLSLVNQKRTICDEKVRAAEMPAGLAAAEAVAALQIVEEAQAEAKAVQTAAETTINGSLDRRSLAHKFHFLDECKVKSRNTEERDLRRTQLQETKVPDLEHSLNEVTRHFLDFKAKIEGSRSWKLYWLSSS